jgi:HlyD family secretion protein
LVAPCDGTILEILAQPGETLTNKPILRMGDISTMYAVAEVYETDRQYLVERMQAHVTSKAFPPGMVLNGVVEQIGKVVSRNDVFDVNPAAQTDRRVIPVRIRLEQKVLTEPPVNLRVDDLINLSVHVEIDLIAPLAKLPAKTPETK